MTEAAVKYVAERILRVQDILGKRLVIENVSTYLMPNAQMSEAEFLYKICEKADCGILLDVNNVYVSSRNHNFDPIGYLKAMPKHRVVQFHVAGHQDNGNWLLDTHDHEIRDEVWDLYEKAVDMLFA